MPSLKNTIALLAFSFAAVVAFSGSANADSYYRESLRNLPGVYVVVETPDAPARALGLDAPGIRSQVEQYLTLHGVPVLTQEAMLETAGAPKLHVQVSVGGAANAPVLWVANVALYQNVTTVEADANVPAGTWLGLTGFGLTPSARLKSAVWSAVRGQLEEFSQDWLAANDARASDSAE